MKKLYLVIGCLAILTIGKGQNNYGVNTKSSLWRYIESIPVIDTHEHFSSEKELKGLKIDFFHLLTPYVIDNLETAGMTPQQRVVLHDQSQSYAVRYEVFNKYYPVIKHTTYMLALQRSLAFEYGMKSMCVEEVERVSQLLEQDFKSDGFMSRSMKKLNIESMLTFRPGSIGEVQRDYGTDNISLVPAVHEICVLDAESLKKIELTTGVPTKNIDDIIKGIDVMFEEYSKAGICNIKIGSAYNRVLNYKNRTRAQAEESFEQIVNTPYDYSDVVPNKYYVYTLSERHIPLDDYLTLYMISKAQDYDMNVIFHLGLAAWNYNSSLRSHASDLEWLFRKFDKTNFVLLHCGYPFYEEAILAAKYYPNVYLNMTWDHIIEREKAIDVVVSFIEMLPTSKIHAFGGDYSFPQQVYGNLIYTKENLYLAFDRLIKKGVMTEDDAKKIAYDWLYANPKSFYYNK